MRIQVLSDLHLEFAPFDPPPVDSDVVVLAGDIGVGLQGLSWAADAFPGKRIVYVPGNHEYYSHTLPALTTTLESAGRRMGIDVLCSSAAMIGGFRFLGTTLWTDFRLHGNPVGSMREADRRMNDFLRIGLSPGPGRFRAEDSLRLHTAARRWLATELASTAQPTVVVTHHAPSRLCITPDYRRESLCPAFASNLDELVLQSGAALWIHGHTHYKTDFRLGQTRVASNPKGYPFEAAAGFDPGFVIEI